MIHVYAEVETGHTLRLEIEGGSVIDLTRAGSGIASYLCWDSNQGSVADSSRFTDVRTIVCDSATHWYSQPIEFGAGGFEYCLVLDPPRSGGISGVVSSLVSTVVGSAKKKSKPKKVTGGAPSRLLHKFDPGFGDAYAPVAERLSATLESLMTMFSSQLAAPAITELLSLDACHNLDFTNTVTRVLQQVQDVTKL